MPGFGIEGGGKLLPAKGAFAMAAATTFHPFFVALCQDQVGSKFNGIMLDFSENSSLDLATNICLMSLIPEKICLFLCAYNFRLKSK
jgi:hypothetical protein